MNIVSFYERNKLKVWIGILVGVPCLLFLGSVLLPDIFWDSFLWKYFWGPVVADSKDRTVDGISAGYNVVNTFVYGICIIISFFGIYELVDHFKIKIDSRFLISLLPWIALGGTLRSLEDVGLFKEPLNLLFISPIIYFVLGISAIICMVLGAYIDHRKYDKKFRNIIRLMLIIPLLLIIVFINGYLTEHVLSAYILLTAVILIVSGIGYFKDWLDETYLFTLYGSSFLIYTFAFNYHYIITLEGTNPWEAVIIPLLSVVVTLVFLGAWKLFGLLRKENSMSKLYLAPLNILIAWSHFFDASATYRGIEHYGYLEKHVLPRFAIDLTGSSLVMYPLKLLIIISAIYLLDRFLKEELTEYPYLRNLIKFVIIVLGAAPAVRNTLRLAMGV
ncbi:MAG: DUF63 family protein [Thermoplasmatota archaeon]